MQYGVATYLVVLVVDRLVNDTVSAFANLLNQLEPLAADFLLTVELLFGLCGFASLFYIFDRFRSSVVAVTLHDGVLATVDVPGRCLSGQTDVFVQFTFTFGLHVHDYL